MYNNLEKLRHCVNLFEEQIDEIISIPTYIDDKNIQIDLDYYIKAIKAFCITMHELISIFYEYRELILRVDPIIQQYKQYQIAKNGMDKNIVCMHFEIYNIYDDKDIYHTFFYGVTEDLLNYALAETEKLLNNIEKEYNLNPIKKIFDE